ncbi:hypothetical protein BOTBODRAFT_49496 [Botryobasidium botryosum FD-172 SS1]|uniref:Uncharacterized protein n=1 Tax=Botryobasidium botryosum (strain FD-172 SS1) TaxID=930990 RepID=A0A067LSI6_BOTB1|nr:hypothetical protein BOTBODRAFT_49496 [Botryobasidium botryosum FD-172 SS1]
MPKKLTPLRDRRIHVEQHKRWGTPSVWTAEWFASTAEYCQTPEGKKLFKEWMFQRYEEQTEEKLKECYAGVQRKYGPSTGNIALFNKAARTLAAPIKKRGEPSFVWLADAIRDQMEVWRTQPDMFFGGLLERAASTIISPGLAKEFHASQARMDAMRSRLHISHVCQLPHPHSRFEAPTTVLLTTDNQIQYAAWSQASSFFEDVEKMGLKTPSAVISAFKKDNDFLGRIIPQVLTSSEYLRPFFIRYRDEEGVAIVQTDHSNPKRATLKDTTIEWLLTDLYRDGFPNITAASLLRILWPVLQKHTEAEKVSAEAFDTIGDFAIVCEFFDSFLESTFGEELRDAVAQAIHSGASKAWFPRLSVFPRSKLESVPVLNTDVFGELDSIVGSQSNTWLGVVFSLDARVAIDALLDTRAFVPYYDHFWLSVDQALWDAAKDLELTAGSLANLFGLFDPNDPDRPLFSLKFLRDISQEEEGKPKSAPAPAAASEPFVSPFPIATPQDSVARAPPRSADKPKGKKKSRGGKRRPRGPAQGQ